MEKSSCPIRNHQFSLRVVPSLPPSPSSSSSPSPSPFRALSDSDSWNGFIRNKVSQFISDAFAVKPLASLLPRVPSFDCGPSVEYPPCPQSLSRRSTKRFLNRTSNRFYLPTNHPSYIHNVSLFFICSFSFSTDSSTALDTLFGDSLYSTWLR